MADAPDAPRAGDAVIHVEDEEVHLEGTPIEGWIALGIFWALGITVVYQFLTRYALNDSAAWTEEIARYLLICTVFVGVAVGVWRRDQIQVDLLYRYLPKRVGRVLSLAVDLFCVTFFASMFAFSLQMMQKLGDYRMTVVDLPMNVVYAVCALAFAAMAVRAGLVLWRHVKHGGLEALKE
jgi:TRAP-type transport system small permease protein